MKVDKWLLNEENDRRLAIAKESKRGYTFNLICDICKNETDEKNPWTVKVLKVTTAKGQADIHITLCTKCLNIIECITNPLIALANTVLIQGLNPKLWPVIEASIKKKKGG